MSRKSQRNRQACKDLFEPIGVYTVTPTGLVLPSNWTDKHAWRDLRDAGRRLSCSPRPGESIGDYANRLGECLANRHEDYIDGASAGALRLIINLYIDRARTSST